MIRPFLCDGLSGAWKALVGAALVVFVVTVGALAVAGCGGSGATEEAATAPTTTAPKSKWNLVAIGDSTPAGYMVLPEEVYTRVYARMVAKELGITVKVHDHATNEFRTLADWFDVVGTDKSLRHDLAGAEITTLFVGTHDFGTFGCAADQWPNPLRDCLRAGTASLPRDFDRLLGAIRKLVPKGATILVGYDGGLPAALTATWSEKPYWPEVKRILMDDWRPGLQAAAKAHDATIIPYYETLFGDDGKTLHPELVQMDGAHFNAAGHRFLAELHAAHDGIGEK